MVPWPSIGMSRTGRKPPNRSLAMPRRRSDASIRPVFVMLLLLCVASMGVSADRGPGLKSEAALVIDQTTGADVYAKNAEKIRPIASITKLMTAMVVLDADLSPDEYIQITDEDKDRLKYSRSRLPVGSRLTRGELLRSALVGSENRAAAA